MEAILQSETLFYNKDLTKLVIDGGELALNTNVLSELLRKVEKIDFLKMLTILRDKKHDLGLDFEQMINKPAQDGRSIVMRVVSSFNFKSFKDF